MPSPSVMRLHHRAEYLACGRCGAVYHRGALQYGRGRHRDEHPEHQYAPCGHSQTWHGSRPTSAPAPTAPVEASAP